MTKGLKPRGNRTKPNFYVRGESDKASTAAPAKKPKAPAKPAKKPSTKR